MNSVDLDTEADTDDSVDQPNQPDFVLPDRTIALVGMMGAGKSAIGRQLAQLTGRDFIDADNEIERAADCTIAEIFERYGEPHFRDGERRVIARLLELPPCILATGGGSFVNDETRSVIRENAISVWLNADFDTLWGRVSRRSHRPLLRTENPQQTLRDLMDARNGYYAMADITVETDDSPKEETARRTLEAIASHADKQNAQ